VPSIRYDRNKQRSYELARIIAGKLVDNPILIEQARRYLDRHVNDDPSQRRYYELWSKILELRPEEIASRLMADSADGELLRDTRPVFYVPSNAERKMTLGRVHRPQLK
jgi:hypothetical protein